MPTAPAAAADDSEPKARNSNRAIDRTTTRLNRDDIVGLLAEAVIVTRVPPAKDPTPHHDVAASGDELEPEDSDRKTQRMSALQLQALVQEHGAEPPRVSTTARVVPRATTVEDAQTTAELAALTASSSRTASKYAFDTSDEPEVIPPPARERTATVEMPPAKSTRKPPVSRAPLATMELSSDMILQIAVNAPLAVKRPPLATMELTADMILAEHVAAAQKTAAAPPAVPASVTALATAPGPALPSIIVDQRGIQPLDKASAIAEPAAASAVAAVVARAVKRAREVARAVETAAIRLTRPPLATSRLAAFTGIELALTVSLLLLLRAC